MRYRYSTAFLTALGALALALPARAQYGTGVVVDVPRATGPITLDGTNSEPDWDNATEVDVVNWWNGGYYEGWGDPEVADVAVTGQLLWREGALILFVRFEDYQELFFGPPGEPYNGEQLLVGVDLTHAGDDQVDENYGGWPDNAPNLGPTTYKISGAEGVGITHNWGFDGISPVDSGWVAGQTYVDDPNFEWGVEMEILGAEVTLNADIGFNIGGGTGDAAMQADTSVAGDFVYGYFSWGASDPPGSAGGDVMNNAASFGTLHLVETVANEGGPGTTGTALRPNVPNPFAGATAFSYELRQAGQVHLAAFDVLGRQVAVLDGGARSAGSHPVVFDASALPSGVYTVRLAVDGAVVASRRVLHTR
jgi:hypothetical protein